MLSISPFCLKEDEVVSVYNYILTLNHSAGGLQWLQPRLVYEIYFPDCDLKLRASRTGSLSPF